MLFLLAPTTCNWLCLMIRREWVATTVWPLFLQLILTIIVTSLIKMRVLTQEYLLDKKSITFQTIGEGVKCKDIAYPQEVLSYEPENIFLEGLMKDVACLVGFDKGLIKQGFHNNFQYGFKFIGVDLDASEAPNSLEYIIYPAKGEFSYNLWNNIARKKEIFPKYTGSLLETPILNLQQAIDAVFLKRKDINTTNIVALSYDRFLPIGPDILPWYTLLLVTIFFFYFENLRILIRFINERKLGTVEYFRQMGLYKCCQRFYTLASNWFILRVLLLAIHLEFFVFLNIGSSELDSYSLDYHHFSIIELITFHLASILFFAYFLSFFFKNGLSAFIVHLLFSISPIFYMMLSLIFEFSRKVQIIFCLLPQICFFRYLDMISQAQFYGEFIDRIEKVYRTEETLKITDVRIMNVANVLIYFSLGIYLDIIWPGKYGTQKTLYCWPKEKKNRNRNRDEIMVNRLIQNPNISTGIELLGLRKIYKTENNGNVTALKNINATFNQGEIIGVMGHQGSGKSTLLTIMAGLEWPSSGLITINSIPMPHDFFKRHVGFCGQIHPVPGSSYFKISLNGMIKGLRICEVIKESSQVLQNIMKYIEGLPKRRLPSREKERIANLGSCLIRDPKMVILDEITTGINYNLKRGICETLRSLRGTHTVIFSTQSLEEVEALCDRVIILNQGEVEFFGSPSELRLQFSTECTLLVTVTNLSKVNSINEIVKRFVKSAVLKSQNEVMMEFKLPQGETPNFPDLCDSLDGKMSDGEIMSYNIGVISAEEKILNLYYNSKEEFKAKKITTSSEVDDFNQIKGFSLFTNQAKALFTKKWIFLRRHILVYLIFFGIFTALHAVFDYVWSLGTVKSQLDTIEALAYSLNSYGDTKVLYSYTEENDLVRSFKKFMLESEYSYRFVGNITKVIRNTYDRNFESYYYYMIGFHFVGDETTEVYFNREATFALPIAVNILANSFANSTNSLIKTSISVKYVKDVPNGISKCSDSVFWIPFRILIEPWIFAMGPLKEIRSNLKTLQLLSVSPFMYWLTHFSFDWPVLFIYSIISFILSPYGEEAFANFLKDNAGRLLLGTFFSSISTLLLIYCTISLTKCLTLAAMLVFFLLITSVAFFSSGDFYYFRIAKYLTPNAIWLGDVVGLCTEKPGNLGIFILTFLIHIFILYLLLLSIELGILRKSAHKFWTLLLILIFRRDFPKNPSVVDEETKVKEMREKKGPENNWPLLIIYDVKRWFCFIRRKMSWKKQILQNIRYCFRNKSIKGVSLAVNSGECFGLVGPEDSGKSTICKILTGALPTSLGKVYFNNISLSNCLKRHKTLNEIGYCPQHEGLFLNFSGRELLEFFARLRGFKEVALKKEVDEWTKKINIEEYDVKKCKTYTFGMQRKLSVAIALIGKPKLVILDEPTANVDPLSCQCIWELINIAKKRGAAVVLTSKNFDEIEVVSDRSATICLGQLCSIGTVAQIKGDKDMNQMCALLLKVNYSETTDARILLKKAVADTFGPSFLCDPFEDMMSLKYIIKRQEFTWKRMYSELDRIKSSHAILESYVVISATIQDLFSVHCKKMSQAK